MKLYPELNKEIKMKSEEIAKQTAFQKIAINSSQNDWWYWKILWFTRYST